MTFNKVEYGKQRMEYRKNNGLCIYCGKKNDNLPKVSCKICTEKKKLSTRRYRERLTKENKCHSCRKQLDREGIYCSECVGFQSEKSRNIIAMRLYNGACPNCGELLDREGFHCSKCLELRKSKGRK